MGPCDAGWPPLCPCGGSSMYLAHHFVFLVINIVCEIRPLLALASLTSFFGPNICQLGTAFPSCFVSHPFSKSFKYHENGTEADVMEVTTELSCSKRSLENFPFNPRITDILPWTISPCLLCSNHFCSTLWFGVELGETETWTNNRSGCSDPLDPGRHLMPLRG